MKGDLSRSLRRGAVRFAELVTVIVDPRRAEYFIGGYVNPSDRVVVLYRGDFSSLVVPLDWFRNSNTVKADPEDFEVIDCGQTIRLGAFEAASDAILFDFDPQP